MKRSLLWLPLAALAAAASVTAAPLGLPPVPIPADNPQTPAKIKLGDRLYHDKRFSSDGKVSCATCHEKEKAFTDHRRVSEGHDGLLGTRNAPTVINAAYMKTLFWDGREPDLEGQSKQPPVNPVEGGLTNHEALVEIIRKDPSYVEAFKEVFGVKDASGITIDQYAAAVASFERTVIAGDSPFDRYQYGGDKSAMGEAAIRGLAVFVGQGRCVSCHIIEQTQALFTDNRFHNIGVGINDIQDDAPALAGAFIKAEATLSEVDVKVLTDARTSELGRFAVTTGFDDLGSFKTPTLRNVAATAPYMHDGSLDTLLEVVLHYNNGGVTDEGDPVNDFLSGGIRPLGLTDEQIDALVAFMESLTSPEFAELAAAGGK